MKIHFIFSFQLNSFKQHEKTGENNENFYILDITLRRNSAEINVSSADMADKMCIQHASFQIGGTLMQLKRRKISIVAKEYNKRVMKRKRAAEKIAMIAVSKLFSKIFIMRIIILLFDADIILNMKIIEKIRHKRILVVGK